MTYQEFSYDLAFHFHAYHHKVLETSGDGFQALFVQIMERVYPDSFEAVRPYGNQGDWKCDGRLGSQYFQCYAPNAMKAREAITKITGDFQGCLDKWDTAVQEWTLVHNSKDGLPPQVRAHVDGLRGANPQIKISEWHRNRLWDELKGLSYGKRAEVLGAVPSREDLSPVSFAEIQVIVRYLAKSVAIHPDVGTVLAPEEKIRRNDLSPYSATLLRVGSQQWGRVKNYIDRHHDPEVGEVLRQHFVEEYRHLREQHSGDSDVIFGKLHRFASCNSDDPKMQGAGLAVLTYFFIACDVFETAEEVNL